MKGNQNGIYYMSSTQRHPWYVDSYSTEDWRDERKPKMTRQELITDFQHFLDTHKEEVEAHLSEPQIEWFEDDGWDDILGNSIKGT